MPAKGNKTALPGHVFRLGMQASNSSCWDHIDLLGKINAKKNDVSFSELNRH